MIRKCKYCGKEFEARGTQVYCAGPHYAVCEVCGTEFEVDPRVPNKCCSLKCKTLLRKKHISEKVKKCELCGKLFHPRSNTSRYCDGPHFRPCPICGEPVEIERGHEYEPAKCCSEECTNKQRRITCLNKYGVEVASQYDLTRSKLREAALKAEKQRQQTCLDKYGVTNVCKLDEIRNKISKSVSSEECQSRIEKTSLERYGFHHSSQSPEIRAKIRSKQYNIFAIDGTHVDSQYEKQVYDFLLKINVPFSYQSKTLEYEYDGKMHSTIVDFQIDNLSFEVKEGHLMQGCFDYQGVPIDVKLDVYRKNHVIVITDESAKSKFGKPNSHESNGLKYLNRCPYPLIGVDIDLFNERTMFPYKDDRPHCFYDVKVDGQKSAYEAFYDSSIRWKMVLNRIMYSGGFIDAAQVLNALNITRTCKQPSWFSKRLAMNTIQKYCSSQTVVDPFAGWGTRADACEELRRTYIGIDFNEKLVNWHHSHGRLNILYGDASNFHYDKECSVFICPPYSDPKTGRCFEDYNFDGFTAQAKALSQCDWMKIVMRNIPNAFEYVLVCKIVDEGWEKFVVDTKQNRSHFGLNNEYILCVPNNEAKKILKK